MKIIDLAECLVTLKGILGKAMLDASDDTQAEIADLAPIQDAFRKLAGDSITLGGTKQRVETHGAHGTVDAAPTSSSEEVARGDSTRRASDSRRPAFDTRYAVDSIFNAPPTEFHAGHSVDSVFGRGSGGDGSQLDHSFASVFKPAPKLAEG